MKYYVILMWCPHDPKENELRFIKAFTEMSAHKTAEKEFEARHAFPKNMVECHSITQFVSFSKRKSIAYGNGFIDGVNRLGADISEEDQ